MREENSIWVWSQSWVDSLLIGKCSRFIPVSELEYPDQKQLRVKGSILLAFLSCTLSTGEAEAGTKASSHITSAVMSRERIEASLLACVQSFLSIFILFRNPFLGNDATHSGLGLPMSSYSQGNAHRSTCFWQFVSMTPSHFELIIKANQDNCQELRDWT